MSKCGQDGGFFHILESGDTYVDTLTLINKVSKMTLKCKNNNNFVIL